MDPTQINEFVTNTLLPLGADLLVKLGGAILFWFIGKRILSFAAGLLERALVAQAVDPTVRRYIGSAMNIVLTGALVVAIFGFLGVETATFAALLAGVGLAVGTAWGDLLKNFAAGVFMLMLRPFKVGDYVTAAGITGTVTEISMFVTVILTPDNVVTMVGNSSVFGGTIQNFSGHPHRRVDLEAQLAGDADVKEAAERIRARVVNVANTAKEVGPDLFILRFNERGPVICVRPYCHTDHYWQVYADTNAIIRDVLGDSAFSVPAQTVRVIQG